MNISFIALNITGAETVQSAADMLRGALSAHGRCDFRLCGSMAQVSASLSDAFLNSELIVVGVEPSVYCKAKLAVLKAMHIKTELNSELKAMAENRADLDSYQLSMHCAMPAAAQVFPTQDGLYSGFAIKSGKQHFILVTLDKLMLQPIVEADLEAYLNIIAPVEQTKKEVKPDCEFAHKAGEALRSCGKKVYFADTPSAQVVKSLCEAELEKGNMIFTDYSVERRDEAPRSYIADLARYAIPQGEDQLGAAVSNVFTGTSRETGGQKYNVYVAVADTASSRVLRFASQPDETPEELITAAIEMLMEMICDKYEQITGAQQEQEAFTAEPIEEIEEPKPEEKAKTKKRAVRTALYAVLAVILAVAVYFGVKGFNNANENRQEAIASFAEYAVGAAFDSGSDDYFEENFTDFGDFVVFEEETEETSAEKETLGDILTAAITTITTKATALTDKIESTIKTTAEKATKPIATAKPTTETTKKTTAAAKPTTTKKTTTAKPTTTNKPTTAPISAVGGSYSGDFVFTVYGYGHGVGMSQEGALAFSKQGKSYSYILAHYYPGTKLESSDSAMPERITFGGVDYPLVEYLCRSVVAEIGGCSSATKEAIKAQAVAIYTYAKRYSFKISASQHAFNKTYNYEGTALEAAVKEVVGVWLSYNSKPAMTTYYAMSAGKTTKASTVWSGGTYPYLEQAVDSSRDKNCKNYKTTYKISAQEFKALMQKNLGIELEGSPENWIKIMSHDSAVNNSIGYVTKMRVGTKTISGAAFRGTAMEYRIRSHCFTVEYIN